MSHTYIYQVRYSFGVLILYFKLQSSYAAVSPKDIHIIQSKKLSYKEYKGYIVTLLHEKSTALPPKSSIKDLIGILIPPEKRNSCTLIIQKNKQRRILIQLKK